MDFEIVQGPLINPDGVDPSAFRRKFLLLNAAKVRLRGAPFRRQRPRPFRRAARTLEIEKTVAHHVAVAQHTVIGRSDVHAEAFAKADEDPELIQQVAFGLRQVLQFSLESRVPQQWPGEGRPNLRRGDRVRITGKKAQEVGGERR